MTSHARLVELGVECRCSEIGRLCRLCAVQRLERLLAELSTRQERHYDEPFDVFMEYRRVLGEAATFIGQNTAPTTVQTDLLKRIRDLINRGETKGVVC